jgi:hypothetical protein
MENKQIVNKIFNIAKHIPEDNNLKKANSNLLTNNLKVKKEVLTNLTSVSRGSTANSFNHYVEKVNFIQKISSKLDDILVKDFMIQQEFLEKEEEDSNFIITVGKLLMHNTLRNRGSIVVNPIELENHIKDSKLDIIKINLIVL